MRSLVPLVRAATALTVLLVIPAAADAQGLGERLRKKAQEKIEQRAEQRAEEAIDKGIDKAEGAIKCAASDKACQDKAKKAGREVEIVSDEEAVAAKQAGAPKSGSTGTAKRDDAAPAAKTPPAAAWANFDFVPGERVLYAEDFAKDRVGNFPQRLDLVNGNAEVVKWDGKTWTQFKGRTAFRVKLPQKLPERFTIELETTVDWSGFVFTTEKWGTDKISGISSSAVGEYAHAYIAGTEAGVVRGTRETGSSMVDPRRVVSDFFNDASGNSGDGVSRPIKVRLQVDGKYTKMYMDEARIANIPNAEWARTDEILFVVEDPYIGDDNPRAPMITNISINAGGQRLYDALMANGRVATQGIYFDTGSDRIRPESGATLKEIGDMLKEHADLKILIEGHTDNVGADAANMTLSDKRAAAVRAYLAANHGIDGSRLTTKGFGATKPVSPNTTAEGRQNNRRVELVKQ